MQKKYLLGSLIGLLGVLGIWQLAANAQTWSGPKAGCYDPSQQNCNVDGVVWNRSNFDTASVQTGNYKLSGSTQIGGDLRFVSDSKAIKVDYVGDSNLNIGNWGNSVGFEKPVNVNILGNLSLINHDAFTNPTFSAPKICLAGDCRTTWPVGGGGGGGTVTSVGSGNGLTGGPIVGVGALSIISCGEGKVLKTVGGVWACADDTDTNSGGTVSTINSPGGIIVTNPNGPTTSLSPDYTMFDGRYVNVAGDTMTGTLEMTPGAGYGLHVNSGGIRVEDGGITNVGDMQNYGRLAVNSAESYAIAAYGSSYGAILSGGVNGLYAGSDTNGAGAYIFYQPVPNAAITKSVTLAGKDYAMDVWGGDTRFQNNVDINGVAHLGNVAGNWLINVQPAGSLINSLGTWTHTGAFNSTGNITVTGGAGKITSGTFCIGVSCINSWPAGGTVTSVTASNGLSATAGATPVISLNSSYVILNASGEMHLTSNSNGYYFKDRTLATEWALYSNNGTAALYNGANRLTLNSAGNLNITGDLVVPI